jgi:hypothetical protein
MQAGIHILGWVSINLEEIEGRDIEAKRHRNKET